MTTFNSFPFYGKKITENPASDTLTGNEFLVLVQDDVSKKITVSELLQYLTSDSIPNANDTRLGIVKLSKAPVRAGTPIAVGTNDERVAATGVSAGTYGENKLLKIEVDVYGKVKSITEFSLNVNAADVSGLSLAVQTIGDDKYILQASSLTVSVWDPGRPYKVNEIAIRNDRFYKSKANSNSGNDPLSNPLKWDSIGGPTSIDFASITGNPDDNPALAGKFTTFENAISNEANERSAADDAYLLLAKAYADLVATDVRRYAGEWDASTGAYPTTNGTGGAIRRGDCFEISVAGTIYGQEFEVGDEIRAKIATPGQTPGNWGSGQVNSQQATTTKVGIARMGTSSEALAGSNPLLMSNPVTVKAQLGDEKKNYVKECYVLSVMEIIFPMELAGQFTALACSSAMSNLQYKLGAAGIYTTFSTPVSYSAGAEVYLKWDYVSPTEQRGWIRMKGKDS